MSSMLPPSIRFYLITKQANFNTPPVGSRENAFRIFYGMNDFRDDNLPVVGAPWIQALDLAPAGEESLAGRSLPPRPEG